MFHADRPGPLPTAIGPVNVAGVTLPAGRPVVAGDAERSDPIAWITDTPVPSSDLVRMIRLLADAFPQTGLWPVAAGSLDAGDLERPWFDGEFDGPDPRTVPLEDVLPERTADGLAEPISGPDLTATDLEISDDPAGLLLVPVTRPANVPCALGWAGPVNHDLTGDAVSTVLRSWEARFGAVLVGLGFDTLIVQISRLPTAPEQFDLIVAEHYELCPDNIDQGLDRDSYRAGLPTWTHWSFWWD